MRLSPKVQQRKAKIKQNATFWQRYAAAEQPAVKKLQEPQEPPQELPPAHARPAKPVVPLLKLGQIDAIRDMIQSKNSELYTLQISLLRNNWDDDDEDGKPRQQRPPELTARCDALESEIARLCDDMKTARAISEPDSEAQSKWFQQQNTRTDALRKNVEGLTDRTPRSMKDSMAAEAARMEQRADSMVRALRASLARGDYDQFVTWRQVQTKELQELELQLAAARASGHGVLTVLAKLEACYADLEDMVRHRATSDASSSDSDTDSELEYEVLAELREGDTVKLVCDDEDGFKRGEEAIVVEVDQSIAYPYRLKAVGHHANGFFKACDLELIRRRIHTPQVVPISGPVVSHVSSPYEKRPSSPYEVGAAAVGTSRGGPDDGFGSGAVVDIEKGRCRAPIANKEEPFNAVRRIALTLNPLASGG